MEEVEPEMEDAQAVKYTWKVENFAELNAKKLYSEVFIAGGNKWRMAI